MYDLDTEKLALAFKTFAVQFDEVRVFKLEPEVTMIGSRTPIVFDYNLTASHMEHPKVKSSLSRFGINTPNNLMRRLYCGAIFSSLF